MAQTITIIVVLALVFVVLPAILKKLTGRDFIELLVGRPLFGKRKRGEDGSRKDGGAGGSTSKTEDDRDSKKEKNSSNADILSTVSEVVKFARRNQYYVIVPGILKKGDLETKLPVILVMRSGVVAINMFGYGGAVSAKKDDEMWTQTMNGESRQIPSPLQVSARMQQTLKQILREIGYGEVDAAVISVFTEKNVKITGPSATEVVRSSALIGELGKSRYLKTKDVDVRELGDALSVFQVRRKTSGGKR